MSDYSYLIRTAESFLAGKAFESLRRLGVSKSIESEFWPAHTIVTYPFYRDIERSNNIHECLAQIAQTQINMANIYIHIPYCTAVCEYCAYSRVGNINEQKIGEYIGALQLELDIWRKVMGESLPGASSLHIGGGTPTAISVQSLSRLIDILDGYFGGAENNSYERSCEVSPETVLDDDGEDKLKLLKAGGVSRISMGVQTFSDKLALEIKRRHTKADVIRAIDNIRKYGFDNINIDLMYGIPGQDLDMWIDSLITAIDLCLPSITLYMLKLKQNSILATAKNVHKTAKWSQQESLLFAYLGKLILEQNGYTQQGVYRFVRDKNSVVRYHTEKYKMGSLLGIGCSSYSFLANCQTYNIFNQVAYKAKVSSGDVPIEVGKVLSDTEIKTRFVIFGIRKGISDEDFMSEFQGSADIVSCFPIIEKLYKHDLIDITYDKKYRLSSLGLLFANEVGAVLASQAEMSEVFI